MLLALAPLALAADTAASVAGMDAASAQARLAQLIAATNLSAEEVAALTGQAPSVAKALADPPTRAAIDLLLCASPADIGKARRGEMVVRVEGKWTDAERDAVTALARVLGMKGAPDTWTVRTEQSELVRFALQRRGKEQTLAVAAPPAWSSPGAALVDPSFENPRTLGLAWHVWTGTDSRRVELDPDHLDGVLFHDEQRHAAGPASLRVTAARGDVVEVRQEVAVSSGDELRLLALVAGDGAQARVVLSFDGDVAQANPAESAETKAEGGTFQPLELVANTPPGATLATVTLRTTGPGSMNWDDVRLSIGGEGGGFTITERGPLRVRHRGTETVDLAEAAVATSRAIMLLALPPDDPVQFDLAGCADLAVCATRAWIERAWGEPETVATAAQMVDAALMRPSPYAELLEKRGGKGLREEWSGR